MTDETNGGNDANSQLVLNEIQARLDAHDLTQAEFRQMMMRFEFQLARERRQSDSLRLETEQFRSETEQFRRESEQFRRESGQLRGEIEASQARTQKHLEHITRLVGIFGNKIYAHDARFESLKEVLNKPDSETAA